jgi:hypothetical protein
MQVRGLVTRWLAAGAFAAVASMMTVQSAQALPFAQAGLVESEWTVVDPGTFGTGGDYAYFGAGGVVKFQLRAANFGHQFGTSDTDATLSPSNIIFNTSVDAPGDLKFFSPVGNPFTFFFQNQTPNTFWVKSNGIENDPTNQVNFAIAQNNANKNLFAFFFDDGGPNGSGDDNDYNDMVITADATPVPEPATILLLGAGLLGGAARLRRRQ